jgi:redox-sensitive bicupin YhaK (pirin superfamily)
MIDIRPSSERGRTRLGWLDSHHTFSFGDYYDPDHERFATLRVINDDLIAPGRGFGMHPHRDMEIISYVVEGALEHKDSLGNGSVLRPGEVQRMSAGTGVLHSEFNPSKSDPTRLIQIWILPERRGIEPGYEQKTFPLTEEPGRWHLVASQEGRDGSVSLHQNVDLYAAILRPGDEVSHRIAEGRRVWLQVARGSVRLNDQELQAGDGAALTDEETATVRADTAAEALLFDLK